MADFREKLDLHPELRAELLARLAHRADRLVSLARRGSFPDNAIALMTEHVVWTAMLICGDKLAHQMFMRVMDGFRQRADICTWCGERPAEFGRLCAVCEAEMIAIDHDLDAMGDADG